MPQHATDYAARQHATQENNTRITKRNCSIPEHDICHINRPCVGWLSPNVRRRDVLAAAGLLHRYERYTQRWPADMRSRASRPTRRDL